MSRRFLACAALLTLLPVMGSAEQPLIEAEILSGWQTPARTQMAGLHLKLAPGWKTYWRSPGDAGIPPQFDWSGSDNVASVRIHWPAPHVFLLNGLTTIGYKGDVVLPLEVTPRDPLRPVRLRGAVELGVCSDICVPARLDLDATMAGPGAPQPAIRAALADRPASGDEAGLAGLHCRVEPLKDGLRVEARIELPATGGLETVVIEPGQPGVWVAEADVRRDGRVLTAVTEMVGPSAQPFALERRGLVVTVLGRDRVVEMTGCPAP